MAKVYNSDVEALLRKLKRMFVELQDCQSVNDLDWHPADMDRALKLIDDFNKYLTNVQSLPIPDCPETHPTEYEVSEPEQVRIVENDGIVDVLRLIHITFYELLGSCSSRRAAKLNSWDEKRVRDLMTKVLSKLAYIQQTQPIDAPESSPRSPAGQPGKTGIYPFTPTT